MYPPSGRGKRAFHFTNDDEAVGFYASVKHGFVPTVDGCPDSYRDQERLSMYYHWQINIITIPFAAQDTGPSIHSAHRQVAGKTSSAIRMCTPSGSRAAWAHCHLP